MDLQKVYTCNICNKNYKHRQSLYNHNKTFHPKQSQKEPYESQKEPYESQKEHIHSNLICQYCDKKYKHYQSKNRHEKKCNKNIEKKLNDKCEKLEKENEEMKINFQNEIEELKNQLKELMNKNCKIHYKTLQKINNQHNIESQNNIQNQQNIQNNNINIIGFTKENLLELFSPKEKLNILQKKFNSLSYIIEYTHFNKKYPQMNNIKITNLNNNIAHIYDGIKNKFVATTKDKLISDLIINRMYDLEEFKGEVMGKMTLKEKNIINKMLEKFYEDEEIFIDSKKEDIKFLVYNNCME